MKKLLSILLCFMLSVSLFTAPSFAAETETDSYQAQLKAAVDLGLLEMNALGRAGKTMSRGEFFNALSILAGADVMTDAPVPFTDIDQKSPYFNGICAVHALGFVGGYGDGTVHPDEPIIMNQAVRLLSYVIGYKDMLDAGYPLTRFVRESNLCGYDVAISTTTMTVAEAAALLMNAGNAKTVSISGYSNKEMDYTEDNTTVFEKYMGIYQAIGLVSANSLTNLSSVGFLPEGKVTVDNITLNEGKSDAGSLLGYNVVAYHTGAKSDTPNTVLHVYHDESMNESIVVQAENCRGYIDGKFHYVEDDKDKSVKISLGTINLVYNNRFVFNPQAGDFDVTSGSVTLIDADTNGVYETAIVNAYTTLIVESVNAVDEHIYGKYNHVVDFGEADRVHFAKLNGEECHLLELAEWDVLAVAWSKDRSVLTVLYMTELAEGSITSLELGTPSYVYIDGVPHELAAICATNQREDLVNMNKPALFGLDIDGKIACVIFGESVEGRYGYLMDWAYSGGLSPVVQVKFLNDVGDVETAELAPRIRFDGERVTTAQNVDTLTAIVPQMIVYGMNEEGKINYLDTAYTVDVDGNITGTKESSDSLAMFYDCYRFDGTMYQDETSKVSHAYRTESKIFTSKTRTSNDIIDKYGYMLACDATTKVFEIPRNAETGSESDYSVRAIGSCMANNEVAYFRAFKRDEKSLVAEVLLQYIDPVATSGLLTSDGTVAVVTEPVALVADEEGRVTNRVTVHYDGVIREYLTRDLAVLANMDAPLYATPGSKYTLGVGDVLKLDLGVDGKLRGCTLIYSCKDAKLNLSSTTEDKTLLGSSPTDIRSNFRVQLANVYDVYKNHFRTTRVNLEPDVDYSPLKNLELETRSGNDYSILVYDSVKNTVTAGSIVSLVGYTNSGGIASSRVVIQDRDTDGRVLVVYQ